MQDRTDGLGSDVKRTIRCIYPCRSRVSPSTNKVRSAGGGANLLRSQGWHLVGRRPPQTTTSLLQGGCLSAAAGQRSASHESWGGDGWFRENDTFKGLEAENRIETDHFNTLITSRGFEWQPNRELRMWRIWLDQKLETVILNLKLN